MGRVIRSILAVIAGFVGASAIMMIVETANGKLLYPELAKRAEGITNRGDQGDHGQCSRRWLVVVLVGWAWGAWRADTLPL